MTLPIHIDTDNGLGSPRGDVDDGFAIAALLKSQLNVLGISSVSGNTPSLLSYHNCLALAKECHYSGPIQVGMSTPEINPAADLIRSYQQPFTLLALGPLTNVAQCLHAPIQRLIVVGGNFTSKGRWPPLYPFEYNLTKDRAATCAVFNAALPITIVPLDVAGRFRFSFNQLFTLPGRIGEYCRQHARRWYRRARILKWQSTVPIWDLLAAMSLLHPEAITTQTSYVRYHTNAWLEFTRNPQPGFRPVDVVTEFNQAQLWCEFCTLLKEG